MFIPAVAMFVTCSMGSGSSVCKDVRTSYSSLVSFLVWHLSIIIDGCTSSDRSPGPMFVKVHVWVSSWSFMWVGVMQVHYDVCACVA